MGLYEPIESQSASIPLPVPQGYKCSQLSAFWNASFPPFPPLPIMYANRLQGAPVIALHSFVSMSSEIWKSWAGVHDHLHTRRLRDDKDVGEVIETPTDPIYLRIGWKVILRARAVSCRFRKTYQSRGRLEIPGNKQGLWARRRLVPGR